MVRGLLAHAPGHGAVFRDGVFQQVAHHDILVHIPVLVGGQIVVNFPEGFRAIVVVGVDDGEGAVHHVPSRQSGVSGAPGLLALLRNGIALRQVLLELVGVADVHGPGHPFADAALEVLLDLGLDDEDHRLEARPAGVVDGVVDDHLVVLAHRVQLLEPAVAAAHASGHDDQNRLFAHHLPSPLYPLGLEDCHFQEEAHMSSMPYPASQPSSSLAFTGSA